MDVRTDFKVAHPGKKAWAGVYGYRPERSGMLNVFGEMFAVMSLSSTLEFDFATVAGLIFDELQNKYYEEGVVKVDMKHFESAIRGVKRRVEEILEREEKLAKEGMNMEMAVAVVKQDVMYAAVIGESRIYVYRESELGEIGAALIDPDMDGFMKTGSMYLTTEDRVLLATSHVADVNSEKGVGDQLEGFALEGVNTGQGAMLLVGYKITLPEKEAAVEAKPVVPTAKPREVPGKEEEAVVKQLAVTSGPTDEEGPTQDDDEVTDFARLSKEVIELDKPLKGQEIVDPLVQEGDVHKAQVDHPLKNVVSRVTPHAKRAKSAALRAAGKLRTKARSLSARGAATRVPLPTEGSPATTSGVFGKASGKVKQIIGKRNGPMYLRGREGGEKWRVVAVVVIVLAVIVFFGVKRMNENYEREARIQGLQTDIGQLESRLTDLKIEARDTSSLEKRERVVIDLLALQTDVQGIQSADLLTGDMKSDLETLAADAQRTIDSALKVKPFTEPQIVNDLAANFEGAQPADIAYAEGNIYIVDKAKGRLYRMGTSLNTEATVVVSDLVEPFLLTADNDGDLVVIDKFSQSSVATVDSSSGSVRRHVGLSPSKEGSVVAIDVWSNDSLYALNAEKSSIVRQTEFANNYAIPNYAQPWTRDASLASGKDIAVEYWVYVLTEGQGIKRYLSGRAAPYKMRGLLPEDEEAIKQSSAIEVTDKHMYVADPLNKRVIVLAKDLQDAEYFDYQGQYVYRGTGSTFSQIKDLIAHPTTGQLFVLDGSQVIRLELASF